MPTHLEIRQCLPHIITTPSPPTTTLYSRYYYHSYSTDVEIEPVPKLHSLQVGSLDLSYLRVHGLDYYAVS